MSIPAKMHAVVLTGHGGFDQLEYHENRPIPGTAAAEARLRVGACGLDNTHINIRTALYSETACEGIGDAGGEAG